MSDFASMVPFAVSMLEILPQNSDPVMSGPFDEPDGVLVLPVCHHDGVRRPLDEPDDYFLRRQKEGQMKQVSEASG